MKTSPRLSLNNGVLIDQLGFGLYKVPVADAAALVATALGAGYRHFDTAAMYGNETGVARGISSLSGYDGGPEAAPAKRRPTSPREDVFITTKVWNDDHGYDATLRAFDTSMVNLGLDYVDMYLIHWPCARRGLFPDTYRALETLYREGKVRAIGVCNFQPPTWTSCCRPRRWCPPSTRSSCTRGSSRRAAGKARAPGNPHGGLEPVGPRSGPRGSGGPGVAAEHGASAAQVILRWHIQLGNIAIPKASSPRPDPGKPRRLPL